MAVGYYASRVAMHIIAVIKLILPITGHEAIPGSAAIKAHKN